LGAKFAVVIISAIAVNFVQKFFAMKIFLRRLVCLVIVVVVLALTAFNLVSIKEKRAKKIEKEVEEIGEKRAEDLKSK
jgi:hypothetical protein